MVQLFDNTLRKHRHARVRRRVSGNDGRPRLAVFRSNRHIYAQLISDTRGRTFVAASSLEKKLRSGNKASDAESVGATIAERAIKQGIKKVVFDRGGYLYHGRVKVLAEAARKKGLQF